MHTSKMAAIVGAIILHNCQGKSLYGLQWCNEAIIGTVMYGTASEDAYESALRSIDAMVVEIRPKEDTYIQGGCNSGCNNTT